MFLFTLSLISCLASMTIVKLLPLKKQSKKRIQIVLYDFFSFLKTSISRKQCRTARRQTLLKNYWRYIIGYLTSREFNKPHQTATLKHARLLNYTISFSTYESMFGMFNEIFGNEIYKFHASTQTPFIIDCGSNIGLATLYFKTLYPQATVIGFEPCPETFHILQKNISHNHLSNVTIHNKAAHNAETMLTFYVSSNNVAHGGWSVKSEIDLNHTIHEQMVPATKLSNYITQPVDLLKIDIEGAEILVLDELAQSGKLAMIKQIILEYHHHMVDPNQDCFARILKHFEDYNFGYQFNAVELATPEKNNRNVLILYVYKKNLAAPLLKTTPSNIQKNVQI